MIKEYKVRFGITDPLSLKDDEVFIYYLHKYKACYVNNKLEPITGIAKAPFGNYTYFINGKPIDTGTKENFNAFLKKYIFT